MKRILRFVAAMVIAGCSAWASPALAELKVGDEAPDFSLMGSDGKTYHLKELRGQHVVVAWFPKAFTGG